MNSYLEPIRSFPIAIGKESGDKFKEGDNRTPEGIYFTQPHINASTLLKSKYGPAAVPVDFQTQWIGLKIKPDMEFGCMVLAMMKEWLKSKLLKDVLLF